MFPLRSGRCSPVVDVPGSPAHARGLGAVLRPGRRAALHWARGLSRSTELALYQQPELDIVTYLPRRSRLSDIDRFSAHVLNAGMALPPDEAIFVATYDVSGSALTSRGHPVSADVERGRILRSVLMKPESEGQVPVLLAQLERLTAEAPLAADHPR